MTEPTGGTPPLPPQEPPVAASVPPSAAQATNWQNPPPVSNIEPGPAPGVAYADLGPRIIALIIDGVTLGIAWWLLLFIAAAIAVGTGSTAIFTLLFGLVWVAITGV